MTNPNLDRHPAWKLQEENARLRRSLDRLAVGAKDVPCCDLDCAGTCLACKAHGTLKFWADRSRAYQNADGVLRAEIARLKDLDTPKCLYCWADAPTREAARAHMEACDKHPMAAMRKELDELRTALSAPELVEQIELIDSEHSAHADPDTLGITSWCRGCEMLSALVRKLKGGDANAAAESARRHNVAPPPVGQAGGEFEQPTMTCPKCQKEYQDFDGVGVVYCQPPSGCGFCRHMARSGEKCDYCGDVRAKGEQLRDGLLVPAAPHE